MYTTQTHKAKKEIGRAGESFIRTFLVSRGYIVYKTNFTRWGSEIDLVVYRQDLVSNTIEVRLVEVKTRSNGSDLSSFKIEEKVRRYKALCVDIGESVVKELNLSPTHVQVRSHIDLAIVWYQVSAQNVIEPYLKKYIQNVNLLI